MGDPGEAEALPQASWFGRAAPATGKQGGFVYKVVGHGPAGDGYQMALELTDFTTAYVTKFSLKDVESTREEEGEQVPLKLRDLHKWLASAFGAGRPVRVEGEGAGTFMVGSHCEPKCLNGGKDDLIIEIRLPPKNAPVFPVTAGPHFTRICSDIAESAIQVLLECQQKLSECERKGHEEEETRQQVADILQLIHRMQHPAGSDVSPGKRKAPDVESPVVDQGSAMKQRPAKSGAAAEALAAAAAALEGVVREPAGGPAASEQQTAGTAATGAPSQTTQSTTQGGGVSQIKHVVSSRGRGGRGPRGGMLRPVGKKAG